MMARLAALVVLAAAAPAGKPPLRVWHITDVHVDPWYVAGADATTCFCEITKPSGAHPGCEQPTTCAPPEAACNCSLTHHGGTPNTANGTAAPFGNSEGNCATPTSLYESALQFMRSGATGSGGATGAPLVYFTGDFAEAGASYPCDGTVNMSVAQDQINAIISYDWDALRAALPNATVLGALGNHDAVPGDVYYGTARQGWLYNHLAKVWGPDLAHEPEALASVRKGGWFSTQPIPGLTVISLNINYWQTLNPQTADPTSSASKLGATS